MHQRGTAVRGAFAYKRIGGQRQTAGEQYPQREIAAVGTIRRSQAGVPQREDFETGEPGARIGKVFAFFAGDFCDRAQHDRGRYRQLDGQRVRPRAPPTAPEAEASAECTTRPPMNRWSRRLNKAMSSARVRAASAALATIDAAWPGNARATNSAGRPASVDILPANPGSSSCFIAAVSAARSTSEKSMRL